MSTTTTDAPSAAEGTAPQRAGLVLLALILVAAVANLNLAVANVALPDIGRAFDSSQTTLDLIAVGYSLGLAASVLYLGALGDRYGRKMMLVLGVALSIPACLIAAYAPNDSVLVVGRLLGGVSAGMAYPTTLALITALWSGPQRTKSIALWSALGGAISALGPLVAGALLQHFWWGSVFLVTLPLAFVALVLAVRLVPAHVNETVDPVDNLGGILSAVLVAGVVLSINFLPVPDKKTLALGLLAIAAAAGLAFVIRQRRTKFPLYDLDVAGRRVFWVAACAGIIVFGSLMGAMFIGQQFLQNVLGYSTLQAGASILPAIVCMVIVAPRSAKLVEAKGARFTLLIGYVFCFLGFLTMLLLWKDGIAYWKVGLGYMFVGTGVGFAGTPASHSLTGSVPVTRAGMASGTADLQRDLGGAIMQSILGALLTAGYASAFTKAIMGAPNGNQVTNSVQNQLTKSFSSAEQTAQQYPHYATQITAAAKASFVDGQSWAYFAGIVAIVLGAGLVYFMFPKHDSEKQLLAEYQREDDAAYAASIPPRDRMTVPAEEPGLPDEAEVEARRERATRRLLRGFRSADSYGLVLLMIVITYVMATCVTHKGVSLLILLQIITVRLSLHTSLVHRRVRVVADVLFVLAAGCAVANLLVSDPKTLELWVFLSATILYFIAPIAIVRHIAFRPQVDQETMLGALCAYLLLGMAFAFTYRTIGVFQSGPFFGSGGDGTLSQDLFFSFTTLTTTGYGNLVPEKNPGQTVAVFEMLIGQLFLVTAVGKIVTAWRPKGWGDKPTV